MVSKELTGTFAYVYFMVMIAFVTMMKILMFFFVDVDTVKFISHFSITCIFRLKL